MENAKKTIDEPSGPWGGKWVEWGLIFGFWTFMAVLMVGNRLLDSRAPELQPRLFFYTIFRFYLWALVTPLIFWLTRRFSIEVSNWGSRVALHLGLAFFGAFVVDLVTDLVRIYFVQPSWESDRAFHPLEDLFALDILYDLTVFLAITAAGFARDYFLRYQARREQAVQLQAQLNQARLEALRMQVNPHFLFNTLHAVSTLVERDPSGVRRMIARLSELLRYTLEGADQQEVPLREEIEFLDGYLDIQQIRFQGKLEVHREIEPDVVDALVPTLILQPLVENAIKHGVSKREGVGHITLRAWREREQLCLSVTDNGPGFSGRDALPSEGEGLGLRNTRARLEGLYGPAHSLSLRSAEEGLVAQMSFPYHTSTDLHAVSAID